MCSRNWLVAALVACAPAFSCSQYNTNLSIQTSSSSLSFVSPSTATVGGQGFTITANGAGYTSGALILWNGTALTTTLVSSLQLTAPVPASDLTTAGTVQISVQIPGSATSGTANGNNGNNNTTTTTISNIVLFAINPAQGTPPAIASVAASTTSKASTPFCSAQGFTLTVTGTNFTSDALVNWNGSPRTTTFASATQLTATISAADAAFPGTAVVTVTNSVGTSNASSFTLSTPSAALVPPTLSSSDVAPTSAPAGSPGFALLPLNSNTDLPANALVITASQSTTFLPCTVVEWKDSSGVTSTLPTEYIPSAPAMGTIPAHPLQLNAAVPAANLLGAAAPQTAQVFLVNPPPVGIGGNMSATASFTISPPSITSVSASTTSMASTPSCASSGFTLTVNGMNFVNGSVVNWNGSARRTTFVSATQLTAAVLVTDIALAGSANITVSSYAVSSTTVPFTISAPSGTLPTPAINTMPPGVSPATATAGTGAFTLSVTGTNFVPCSGVQWNGMSRTTTYVSPTQLQATIFAADIAAVGTFPVTVSNPASGGVTSNSVSVSVVAPTVASVSPTSTPFCSPSGLTLTVNGTNFVNGLVVNWNGSPRPTTYVSATQLTAAITEADTAFQGTVGITVSSLTTTSTPAVNFSMTTPATNLPAPTINSLTPPNAAVGGPGFTLTVNGTNLLPCSTVNWGASALATTFITGTTTGITAAVPATDIASTGPVSVTVTTPAPGGGPSNPSTFTVYTPPASPALRTAADAQLASSSVGTSAGLLALPLVSADRRYAVLVLASTDGVTEIPGTTQNIFVRDTCAGTPAGCTPSVKLASIGFNSNPADGDSSSPSISADGRYVAFLSVATNLVASDANGVTDVFVRDTCAGTSAGCTPSTQRVSVASDGTQANGASTSATISADGRYVTFVTAATSLGSTSSSGGIFLRDTCTGALSGCTPSTHELN